MQDRSMDSDTSDRNVLNRSKKPLVVTPEPNNTGYMISPTTPVQPTSFSSYASQIRQYFTGLPSPITPGDDAIMHYDHGSNRKQESSQDTEEFSTNYAEAKEFSTAHSNIEKSSRIIAEKKSKKKAGSRAASNDSISTQSDQMLANAVQVIPGRLYFDSYVSHPVALNTSTSIHVFSVDVALNYSRFHMDFGPVNISQVIKFKNIVEKKLSDPLLQDKPLLMIAAFNMDKCSNAIFLLASYLLLSKKETPEKALSVFMKKMMSIPIAPFRDAGYGMATYWIDILDCLKALYKGVFELKLVDIDTFDTEQYDYYEKVENGDFNWVIPNYFLAMATPHDNPPPGLLAFHEEVKRGNRLPTIRSTRFRPMYKIEDLLVFLKELNIKAVVRLNNKMYDRNKVLEKNLEHYELYFPDGSVPKLDTIVQTFLEICDKHLPPWPPAANFNPADFGPIAIHCKAGLGRTGSLICCWMIKKFGWTARNCISWCRIMRPGSVVGPQQNWLESVEPILLKMGENERVERDRMAIMAEARLANFKSHRKTNELNNGSVSSLLVTLDVNDGTDELADVTNGGYKVPVQPNKLVRQFKDSDTSLTTDDGSNTTEQSYNFRERSQSGRAKRKGSQG